MPASVQTRSQPPEFVSPFRIELTRHEVILPFLPAVLDGTTLVQLSDLHRGKGGTDPQIRAAITEANSLRADYVVLTGDFVNDQVRDIEPVVEMVSRLEATSGRFAIFGNHDYYADERELEERLEAKGIHVLRNRAVELKPGLWIAGVDDLLKGEHDLRGTLEAVPTDAACVLLAHEPNFLRKTPLGRPLLMLSGHTHGGQFVLPFPTPSMICRFHLHTPYVHGWYQRGAAQMYVNRGIGVTGPDLLARRINCPPEISHFTLRSG